MQENSSRTIAVESTASSILTARSKLQPTECIPMLSNFEKICNQNENIISNTFSKNNSSKQIITSKLQECSGQIIRVELTNKIMDEQNLTLIKTTPRQDPVQKQTE